MMAAALVLAAAEAVGWQQRREVEVVPPESGEAAAGADDASVEGEGQLMAVWVGAAAATVITETDPEAGRRSVWRRTEIGRAHV